MLPQSSDEAHMPKGEPTDAPRDAPQTVDAFRDRLMELNGDLPRRLQQCADHVARHLDSIALSTVAQVAQGAGVPPSAVMRFCQIMGFSGFAEMQRLFRQALSRLTMPRGLLTCRRGGRGSPPRWWPNSSKRAASRWRLWRAI
jgi:hypothetical protein